MSYDYNPLILPSTSQAGDLGDTQLQPGDPWRLTCLDLSRDLVLGRLTCLSLLGDQPVRGSQEVKMPQPAQGPNSREATSLDLPGDSIFRRMTCLYGSEQKVLLHLLLLLFGYSVISNSSVTPWIVAHQSLLSMGFSRQEYWRGLPTPPGDLPKPPA